MAQKISQLGLCEKKTKALGSGFPSKGVVSVPVTGYRALPVGVDKLHIARLLLSLLSGPKGVFLDLENYVVQK